jgi:hypothetical protein
MKKIIQPISILLIITLLSAICIIPYAATIVNGGNYEFTVMDATKVQKYVVGMIDLTDDEKFLYDTNGDNVLTVIDATNIQKIIVGSQFDTSEPSSLTETTSVYGTEASTETTISDFSSACTEVTTEYTETTAYTETTTECVEETTIVDEPSTESTETTTEEVTEPSTEEYTEQITEQPTTEPKPTVPPKSVKFNKNTITLGVGESYTLITTILTYVAVKLAVEFLLKRCCVNLSLLACIKAVEIGLCIIVNCHLVNNIFKKLFIKSRRITEVNKALFDFVTLVNKIVARIHIIHNIRWVEDC